MGVLRALENDGMFNRLIKGTQCNVGEPQVDWVCSCTILSFAPVSVQHGSIVAYSIIHSQIPQDSDYWKEGESISKRNLPHPLTQRHGKYWLAAFSQCFETHGCS